jgi:hypothetical protein
MEPNFNPSNISVPGKFVNNQQRSSSNNNQGSNSKQSSANNKAQPSHLSSPFDALNNAFGNDLNSAVAALTAASGGNLDSAALAQINALAQLNQFATNQKFAAAMMQQQQHLQSVLNNNQSQTHLNALQSFGSQQPINHQQNMGQSLNSFSNFSGANNNLKMNQSRYQQLLSIIDEMGKEIRNTYVGNKNSMERLKRGIASARILVKDCQLECEKGIHQSNKINQ